MSAIRQACAAAICALVACTQPGLRQAVESPDAKVFRDYLEQRVQDENFEWDDARDVAIALMTAELGRSHGNSAERQLDGLKDCAHHFSTPLAALAQQNDELGARAAMLQLEARLRSPLTYWAHVESSQASWRAVAARSLVVDGPATSFDASLDDEAARVAAWRRQLMSDPVREVRVAAVRAAVQAADVEDLDELLEVARLDPDDEIRELAVKACGVIGNRESVLGLLDLWASADDELREVIVEAWERAAQLGSSVEARARLRKVSETANGMPALLAALALLGDRESEQATMTEAAAAAVVARAISDGTVRVRIAAIERAPRSWPSIWKVVQGAREATEPRVTVAALARLAELPGTQRREALSHLRELGGEKDLAGASARRALAILGDRSVLKLLEHDATASDARHRSAAAQDYAKLGRFDKAARLLADSDAYVRSRTACALVGATP